MEKKFIENFDETVRHDFSAGDSVKVPEKYLQRTAEPDTTGRSFYHPDREDDWTIMPLDNNGTIETERRTVIVINSRGKSIHIPLKELIEANK